MKRIFIFLSTLFLLSLSFHALAAGNQAVFTIGNSSYNVNGTSLTDSEPYIKDGRTFLPLRYAAYSCGIGDNSITWNQENQTAILSKNNTLVMVKLGENSIYAGGQVIPTDTAAEIYKDRVMLPLRAVAEALRCQVKWDPEKQQVTIVSN